MIMPKGEIIPTGEAMFRRKRKHSDSFYAFMYAFLITLVVVGTVILFMLSDFK